MDTDLETTETETTETDASFWAILSESVGAFIVGIFGALSS